MASSNESSSSSSSILLQNSGSEQDLQSLIAQAFMASPNGSSSSSSSILLQNSGSEEDLPSLIAQKKWKRKISNRESARRPRMRKQKHLDDLTAQVNQLRKENTQISTYLTLTAQKYFAMEADNSVQRTRVMELSNMVQSLYGILNLLFGLYEHYKQ